MLFLSLDIIYMQICSLSRIRRLFSSCTRHVKAFDESSDGVVRSEGLPNSDVKRYLDLFGGHARKGKNIIKY